MKFFGKFPDLPENLTIFSMQNHFSIYRMENETSYHLSIFSDNLLLACMHFNLMKTSVITLRGGDGVKNALHCDNTYLALRLKLSSFLLSLLFRTYMQ